MTSAVLRSAQAGAILTAVGLSAGLMTGVAVAAPPDVAKQSCLSPLFPGSDLNERYGVKERIIGPPASAQRLPAARHSSGNSGSGPSRPGSRRKRRRAGLSRWL